MNRYETIGPEYEYMMEHPKGTWVRYIEVVEKLKYLMFLEDLVKKYVKACIRLTETMAKEGAITGWIDEEVQELYEQLEVAASSTHVLGLRVED